MSGTRRLRLLASAGGAALVLTTCGARGMTTAEPAARIVSICPAPGRARLSCDTDARELAQARRLTEQVKVAATTTTPTTAATTSTAATTTTPTTVAETTTVATEANAPAPEATPADAAAPAAPAEPAPEEAAPAEEAPAEPEPEEEPATTAPKRKKTPKTTPAPAPAEEAPATDAPSATEAPAPAASVRVDTSVAGRVIALTNAQRAAAGLAPVSANGALTAAAAAHSKDQAANNHMTHTGSNGSTLGQRLSAAGFAWHTAGENVAAGYGSADSVMNGWMNSAGHRANILKADFTSIGVAVAYAADGTAYWTMDLGA